MSGFHAKCVAEPPGPNKKARSTPLTSKPFCDCQPCACPDCPDILKMLAITVTENSCDFGSKVKGKKPRKKPEQPRPRSSLLDVLADRDCGCEVVARAVRAHVHTNLGLTEHREAANDAGASPLIPRPDPE